MNINYTLLASCIAATASLAAACIAYFSKERDFKKDYYKKIIEKRFNVYQDLEKVLYELRGVRFQNNTKKEYPIPFSDKKRLLAFKELIFKPILEGFWLSEGARRELIKLHNLVRQVFEEANELEEQMSQPEGINYEVFQASIYASLGVKYYLEITGIAFNISLFFKKDLPELHKVEKYLKYVVKQSEKAMKEYAAKQVSQKK